MATVRLHVLGVGADIADVGIGQGDKLTGVGGITENLLIARHGGIEDHLAHGGSGSTESDPVKYGAVGQAKHCSHSRQICITSGQDKSPNDAGKMFPGWN